MRLLTACVRLRSTNLPLRWATSAPFGLHNMAAVQSVNVCRYICVPELHQSTFSSAACQSSQPNVVTVECFWALLVRPSRGTPNAAAGRSSGSAAAAPSPAGRVPGMDIGGGGYQASRASRLSNLAGKL